MRSNYCGGMQAARSSGKGGLRHFRGRENRDTRTRRGYSPWSRCDWPNGPFQATTCRRSIRGSLRHPLRRGAYPRRTARLAPGQGLERRSCPPCRRARSAPVACGKPASCNARACGPVSRQVRPVDKSGWQVKGARAAPAGWSGPQPQARTRARRGAPLM
jgi:hypothetical protein